jgi:hypothetical protein
MLEQVVDRLALLFSRVVIQYLDGHESRAWRLLTRAFLYAVCQIHFSQSFFPSVQASRGNAATAAVASDTSLMRIYLTDDTNQ